MSISLHPIARRNTHTIRPRLVGLTSLLISGSLVLFLTSSQPSDLLKIRSKSTHFPTQILGSHHLHYKAQISQQGLQHRGLGVQTRANVTAARRYHEPKTSRPMPGFSRRCRCALRPPPVTHPPRLLGRARRKQLTPDFMTLNVGSPSSMPNSRRGSLAHPEVTLHPPPRAPQDPAPPLPHRPRSRHRASPSSRAAPRAPLGSVRGRGPRRGPRLRPRASRSRARPRARGSASVVRRRRSRRRCSGACASCALGAAAAARWRPRDRPPPSSRPPPSRRGASLTTPWLVRPSGAGPPPEPRRRKMGTLPGRATAAVLLPETKSGCFRGLPGNLQRLMGETETGRSRRLCACAPAEAAGST